MGSERVLPHDIGAEKSVVGCVLFHGECIDDVRPLVKVGDFYDAKHEAIYEAACALAERREKIDMITVAEEMRRTGTMSKLGAVGNEAFLAELASGVATWDAVEFHAQIVREKAMARQLIMAGDRIMQAGYSGQVDAPDLLAMAQRQIGSIADATVSSDALHIKAVLNESVRELERRYHDKRVVTGVPSGIHALDEMTSGWQETDLIVVAARPSMGKTGFAADCVLASAAAGFPTMFFSTEMGRKSIGNRLLSSDGRVDGMLMRNGLLESRDWIRLTTSAQRLAEMPIWIHDARQTVETIAATLKKWKRNRDNFDGDDVLGLAVIDYLQLIGSSDSRAKNGTRDREVALITKGLKDLAKELRLALVLLSQLNRGPENRSNQRPTMADLRDSGSIEQDADVMLGLYRDEYYNKKSDKPGMAELILMKQRNGQVGTVECRFEKQYTKFSNLGGYRG